MSPTPFTSPYNDDPRRQAVNDAYRADETEAVRRLLVSANLNDAAKETISVRARQLVEGVRGNRKRFGGIDAFLQTYGLSTREGVALMCLAEALLRIPDTETKDRMIRDKLLSVDWNEHAGEGAGAFVNASTWALMLTGKVLSLDDREFGTPGGLIERLVARAGEPVIRESILHAMQILGRQFVLGRTIKEGLSRARAPERAGCRFSFDMLGEAARTADDAKVYLAKYPAAVKTIAAAFDCSDSAAAPGVSVKLSGFYPRDEFAHRDRALPALVSAVRKIAILCKDHGVGLTIDAEEAERLDLFLDVFAEVYSDPALGSWDGFGIALQSYQKRAFPLIDWLAALAEKVGRRIMVRLVKGAYWDSEIKKAQEAGLEGYPVFTRKASTDVSFLACTQKLLDRRDVFYAQFATHNAHTLASVMAMAGDREGYEFQRLHGMGGPLYHQLQHTGGAWDVPVRTYAPIGSHEELLPYLVRRLLENGSNSSFVNRIQSDSAPIDDVIRDPIGVVSAYETVPHPKIPLPRDLFGSERVNALGLDLHDAHVVEDLYARMQAAWDRDWEARPLINGEALAGTPREAVSPADNRRKLGVVHEADASLIGQAMVIAEAAFARWRLSPVVDRALILERAADLFEDRLAELMAIIIAEGGRTVGDALSEVREAIDFLRYYAARARATLAEPMLMPGYTGEDNRLMLYGRGVFVCISPWNFPLAIFTGQVSAALAAGNCVVAKPARQTPLAGYRAVQILHEAGIPGDVLQFVPGPGGQIGNALVDDPRTAGVCFTGSNVVASGINRRLAAHEGVMPRLIAETGGQNAMIVDSSALPEQVVDDVLTSGFRSAGQRCSCLRALFLHERIADRVIAMLQGATEELIVGDPADLATDIGPVIDHGALAELTDHAKHMGKVGTLVAQATLGTGHEHGSFFVPRAFEIDGMHRVPDEVFGPIVHVLRYAGDKLDSVIDAVNGTGYGLTLGIHTRIDAVARHITARAQVGNVYVNRNMIGAVVGVQPFGGQRLSGTGPKAGGPLYLYRFVTEQTLSVNTTAIGGNTDLVSLADEA